MVYGGSILSSMGKEPPGRDVLPRGRAFASIAAWKGDEARRIVGQHARPSQKVRQRTPKLMEVGGGRVSARHKHQVPTVSDRCEPRRLPDPASHRVSHHRFPDSPPHRETEPGDVQVITPRDQDQEVVRPAFALTSCRRKVSSLSQTLVFTHQRPSVRGGVLDSDRKPSAPLEHAPLQDVTAAAGTHT